MANEWIEVAGTASISFGAVQLYCYPAPRGNGYRYKIGSVVSQGRYKKLESAKEAGLIELERLGQAIIDGVRGMPGRGLVKVINNLSGEVEPEEELDSWHLSILGIGKPKGHTKWD